MRLNGVTGLALTKIDVLTGMKEIKVCTAYKLDGKVTDTVPGIKGATASAQKKPAKLETGLVVQVPSFINEGEVVRIGTENADYLGRATS